MKIKIEIPKFNAIQDALDAVNGKATTWTICSAADVKNYADEVEKRLAASKLPKDERAGVTAVISPKGPAAKSYKYPVKATRITIERGASAWYLTDVQETSVYPGNGERINIRIKPDQRDTIQRKAVEDFIVTAEVATV